MTPIEVLYSPNIPFDAMPRLIRMAEIVSIAYFPQQFLHEAQSPKLDAHDKFLGLSVWEAVDSSHPVVVIAHFANETQMYEHFEWLSECLEDPEHCDIPLPEITSFLTVDEQNGMIPDRAPEGTYLMIGHSVARLGYGEEAVEHLNEALEDLTNHGAAMGYVQGRTVSMEDEVWGVTLWKAPPAGSIPEDLREEHNLELYRRVA